METTRSSLIMKEIERVFAGSQRNVHFAYTAELFANDIPVEVYRLDFINISGDYGSGYQDDITVGFRVLPSIYQKVIYPNRNNLMIHLSRVPVGDNGGNFGSPVISIQKLRAYLVRSVDLLIDQTVEMNENDLDQLGFMELPLQVTDPLANRVRLYQCGMNYRSVTPAEALCATLQRAISESMIDGRVAVPKIAMRAPDNVNKRPNIVIPLKPLLDIPHYLQDYEGGIYNAGIRMYFHRNIFYVWPKYYLGQNPGERRVLTIFNIPANQFPGVERTYRETEYQVIVIATGKSTRTDTTQAIELNEGNGVRFTDANAVLNGMVVREGNKSIMRRGFANSEFIDSETGRDENYAPMSARRITANPYAEVSRIAANKGIVEVHEWQNADPSVIFPGMDVRVISMEKGRMIEREGSLVGSDFHMSTRSNSFKDTSMTITGALSVFLNKKQRVVG